jgi:hypothetical protein
MVNGDWRDWTRFLAVAAEPRLAQGAAVPAPDENPALSPEMRIGETMCLAPVFHLSSQWFAMVCIGALERHVIQLQ